MRHVYRQHGMVVKDSNHEYRQHVTEANALKRAVNKERAHAEGAARIVAAQTRVK